MKTLATAFLILLTLTVQSQIVQLPPVLTAPANGSANISLTPNLAWNLNLSLGTLLYFKVQVATDLNFNNIIYSTQVNQNLLALPQNLLSENTRYYWRVQAIIDLGLINITTNFSSPFSFTTIVMTGITQTNSQVPDAYRLYENYPNPFNPSTNIRFDIKSSGTVNLTVYSITGEAVSVPVNHTLEPGKYELTWNASGLSSGIYFYRLTAGDFSATKKMILTK